MKFNIEPELFDNFIDAICIVNNELVPIYFNSAFSILIEESSNRSIRKKKIFEFMSLEDFNWEQVKEATKESLSSQVREVKYKIKNREGALQITWKSIQSEDESLQVAIYLRDVSLEAELTRKYHEQLSKKNETIKSLDEHIFQISLIRDILEKATGFDDPLLMLRNLFSNLSQVLRISYVYYFKQKDVDSIPELATFTAPGQIDENEFEKTEDTSEINKEQSLSKRKTDHPYSSNSLARQQANILKDHLQDGHLLENKINDLHWIVYKFKNDTDYQRYFVFGKKTEFSLKDEKLITTISDPMVFSLDNRELFKKAITDEMTDLYNHRYFKLRLSKEIRHHKVQRIHLGLLILDIDFFKKVNDTYGHLAGDQVLQAVSACLKSFCRTTDIPSPIWWRRICNYSTKY